jgi:hypothetical protein
VTGGTGTSHVPTVRRNRASISAHSFAGRKAPSSCGTAGTKLRKGQGKWDRVRPEADCGQQKGRRERKDKRRAWTEHDASPRGAVLDRTDSRAPIATARARRPFALRFFFQQSNNAKGSTHHRDHDGDVQNNTMDPLPDAILKYERTLWGQLIVLIVFSLLWNAIKPTIRRWLFRYHSSHPYWEECQKRTGYFGPCSKELMWNSLSCVQHFLAGSLMVLGWAFGEAAPPWSDDQDQILLFFRLGVIAEVSFELLDILDMIHARGMWATTPDNPKIHPGAYVSAIAHHLPGLFLVFPLNLWCSCVGIWQRCAVALELGGGMSILLLCYRESLIGEGESAAAAAAKRLELLLVDLASLLFLMWVRFFVVTPAMYEIGRAGLDLHCKTTYAVIVGAVFMTTFNVLWCIDNVLKVVHSGLQLVRVLPQFKESGPHKKVE